MKKAPGTFFCVHRCERVQAHVGMCVSKHGHNQGAAADSDPSVQTETHSTKPGPSSQEKMTAKIHSCSVRLQSALSGVDGDVIFMGSYRQGRQASPQPWPILTSLRTTPHAERQSPSLLLLRARGQRALAPVRYPALPSTGSPGSCPNCPFWKLDILLWSNAHV